MPSRPLYPVPPSFGTPPEPADNRPFVERLLWLIISLVASGVLAIIAALVIVAVTGNVEKALTAGGGTMAACAAIGIAAIAYLHGSVKK